MSSTTKRTHEGQCYKAVCVKNQDSRQVQFFLNHRRYLRSEDPSRVGKSPAELLTGEPHAHWLELLGYTRFSRN